MSYVMRPSDEQRFERLTQGLVDFDQTIPLLGLGSDAARASFARQIIDSFHRVEYVERLGERAIDPQRADPQSPLFDPLKAAKLHQAQGDIDEAAWLVFMATHFGFHRRRKWEATQAVYGALGLEDPWTWLRVTGNPAGFRRWFLDNARGLEGLPFGNHRKYESLRADAAQNLADTVASYLAWVGPNRGHALLFSDAFDAEGHDPRRAFDRLYQSMDVARFGRTARFDYLTMLGKLGLSPIDPPHPYLENATGPLSGSRLLFGGRLDAAIAKPVLRENVIRLGDALGANMQVMEDSICNWQKSPTRYVSFRG